MVVKELIGQGVGIRLITLERAINGGFPRPGQGDRVDDFILFR